MKTPEEVLNIFEKYTPLVEDEIKAILDEQEDYLIYDMMRYFFGFRDESLNPTRVYGGKRYRSGLCLLISDFLGSLEKAQELAAAIEVFHNFTLIHDDIVDKDEYRRGRPTVWKLWGEDHAINTGDGKFLLSQLLATRAAGKHSFGIEAQEFLQKRSLEVVEGQYLDFTLTALPIDDFFVNEENYLEMTRKKTSVLVGAATKTAAIVAGLPEEEKKLFWEYGVNLGLAYQLCDDIVSVWGNPEITGKTAANDLFEKKKTLPVLFLYCNLPKDDQKRLAKVYNQKRRLTEREVKEIISMLDGCGAYDYCWDKIQGFSEKSKKAVDQMPLDSIQKKTLRSVNDALLPDVKGVLAW